MEDYTQEENLQDCSTERNDDDPENLEAVFGGDDPKPEKPHDPIKTLWTGILIGILVVALGFGGGLYAFLRISGMEIVLRSDGVKTMDSVAVENVIDSDTSSKLLEVQAYINHYFTGEVDQDTEGDALVHALVESLGDQYSEYYNKQEYEDLQVTTTGEYYGIGAGLLQDQTTKEVTVSKVYEGTPAEEAGLLKGDVIISADDYVATEMELSDLVSHIRGEEGTTVHLSVYRESEDQYLEFDVERRNVTLPSVESEMMADDLGYIQISQFQSDTASQFEEQYDALKEEGMKGVLVDLRSNPGGMLDSVVEILDYLLPEGTVVYTEDKNGEQEIYSSDASCQDLPMVVLIDGDSASASEIFAGAVKDYEYATLVGENTFGKGIVQSVFRLSDGDALKLTTAKYFTPKGNYIHGVGIAPDVEVEYQYSGPDDETYDKQYDSQVQKGIGELKKLTSGK